MSKLTKVFVGNLAFTTKESELASSFDDVGKVLSANIITRGPRSLGYGFVEFETEEEAKKAVTAMDKKELDGRVINVEVAKEREEGAEKPARDNAERPPRRPRLHGRKKKDPLAEEGKGAAEGTEEQAQVKPRRPKPRKKRGPKPKEGEEGAEKVAPIKRGRRPRIPDEQKEESKTTIFVANLPRNLEDEAFEKLFTDAGLKPKQTRVVRFHAGRSRGFGFVEFETEEEQKKVLEQKFTIQERELVLRIAHFVKNPEENPEEKKEETKEEKKDVEKKDAEKPAAKTEEPTKKEEVKK